jgi:V/A-type H+-transporting ATPase subunit C
MMDYSVFAHSIARIKALENKMLGRAKLDSLIDAKDFPDCIKMVQDTQYGPYLTTPSYEEGLKHALQDLYKYMYEIVPVKEIIDILAVRYDEHNIKSILKGMFTGINTSGMLINVGTIPLEALKRMIMEEDFREVPDTVVKCVRKALSAFESSGDPQDIDIIIDKGMYEYAFEIAKKSGFNYLSDYLAFNIDILNLKTYIRIKAQERSIEFLDKVFIQGGTISYNLFSSFINEPLERFANKINYTVFSKWADEGIGAYIRTGDLGAIEKYGDNYLMNHIKKAKFTALGPEPIIAYIAGRENEIRSLRIILTGKKNEVHPDIIRERMRDVYV